MAIIQFNETQKAAIVSLLIEMINADSKVVVEECTVFDTICVEYAISEDIFSLGRSLDSMAAINIMKNMSDVQKIATAQLLIRVIDADACDDDKEIQLFNIICRTTGVDVLVNARSGEE